MKNSLRNLKQVNKLQIKMKFKNKKINSIKKLIKNFYKNK